ncbi:MAG: amino acid adenylation domain-containing protein [Ketobacteraceae bacterium]|nr:amino acid adenylation domain-containing protein [Ketobacteraceae bacterium]
MTEHFNPFAGGEILKVSPTTGPQREVITCSQLSDEANTAYNEGVIVEFEGAVDAELLERCFQILHKRHDILRATFSRRGDELCLGEEKPFRLTEVDLQSLEPAIRQQKLEDLKRNIAISPMNLEEGPLFFAWLYRMAPEKACLVIAAHHVICDGWSFGLLLNELRELYRTGGNDESLAPAPSFFDYAEKAEAAEVTNSDIDYWRSRFRETPPTLDLPLDFPRPLNRTFQAARLDYALDGELVSALPKAAASLKASLVNVVLAGYFTLLHRLTGNTDIIVGLPVAGQAAMSQLKLFGHLVQLLPIPVKLASDISFSELLAQVKQEVLNASEHPNFTFGQLLEQLHVSRHRVPLINTLFNIDQPMPPLDFGTCTGYVSSIPRAAEAFELFLNVVPSKGALVIEATYSTALFREDTIRAWLSALETLLESAIREPAQAIGSLPLAKGIPNVLEEANQTAQPLRHHRLIDAFREQVALQPDATACISRDISLSYQALDQASSQLAEHLQQTLSLAPGAVVGICCERTEKLLTGILAILKAGASYLPLDPDFPIERLNYMLSDSGAAGLLRDSAAPSLDTGAIPSLDLEESLQQAADIEPADAEATAAAPEDCAYIIYTSGSTGKPKGVRVPHRAMMNFLESMARTPGCHKNDRLLAITTLSFDISVLELYLPLVTGATTVIADRAQAKEGEQLSELIEKHDITLLQATPSTWRLLLASRWRERSSSQATKLKALCGGEPLPTDLTEQLLPLVAELWNMYGPTETTVWSTCKKISANLPLITVGTPISNTRVYLLDEQQHPVPLSVPGEICIGGTGLSLGYHNRPELNRERFISHPEFGDLYRTGDLGKLLPTGEIQHLGRMDDQVKLRGYRIELGEIENALVQCPSVAEAAVYLWQLSPSDIRIVACCVAPVDSQFQNVAVRKQLREKLPHYMIPQYLLPVDSIPLTPNGKVDRKALPRPELAESTLLSQRALQNDREKTIAAVWTDLIKPTQPVGPDDNFFEIGGHSLLALEAIRQIELKTGHRFTTADLVVNRVSSLADIIATETSQESVARQGPEPLPAGQPRQLSKEQERIVRRHQQLPDSTANNLPAAWLLKGSLDQDAFQHSLRSLFDRQTALRTVIREKDGWVQQLVPPDQLDIPHITDLSGQDDPLSEALTLATGSAQAPFSVLEQALCRAELYRLSENEHLFVLTPHQLVFDGWSFDIFLSELETYYEAYASDKASDLGKLAFEFRDYTHWHRHKAVDKEALAFHRRSLEQAQEQSPASIQASSEKGQCMRKECGFSEAELHQVEAFCETYQLRLHEVLFAAFIESLCHAGDCQEITVGLPVTGRYDPDVINLVGSFVSTLPFTAYLTAGNFITRARDLARQLKEFHEHQDITCADIIENTRYQQEPFASFIPASFGFQDIRNRPTRLADLILEQLDMPRAQTECPLEFWVRIQPRGLVAVFDYDNKQVPEELVQAMESHLSQLLASLHQLKEEPSGAEQAQVNTSTKRSLWRRLFQ